MVRLFMCVIDIVLHAIIKAIKKVNYAYEHNSIKNVIKYSPGPGLLLESRGNKQIQVPSSDSLSVPTTMIQIYHNQTTLFIAPS